VSARGLRRLFNEPAGGRAIGVPLHTLEPVKLELGQRGGVDDAGVPVHTAEQHLAAGGAGFDVGGSQRPALRPGERVPAVTDQRPLGLACSVVPQPFDALGDAGGPAEVHTGQPEACGRGVDVRVDERRGDPGAAQVLGGVSRWSVARICPHPDDPVPVHDHGADIGPAVERMDPVSDVERPAHSSARR
jgi:hypothetical protein